MTVLDGTGLAINQPFLSSRKYELARREREGGREVHSSQSSKVFLFHQRAIAKPRWGREVKGPENQSVFDESWWPDPHTNVSRCSCYTFLAHRLSLPKPVKTSRLNNCFSVSRWNSYDLLWRLKAAGIKPGLCSVTCLIFPPLGRYLCNWGSWACPEWQFVGIWTLDSSVLLLSVSCGPYTCHKANEKMGKVDQVEII